MFSLPDAERITPRLVWLVMQHAVWSLQYFSVNYLFDTVTGGDVGCGPIREVWVVLPTEQESVPERREGASEVGRDRLKIAQLVETSGCKSEKH